MLDKAAPLQQQPMNAASLFSGHRRRDHVGSGRVQGERCGWVRFILPHHGFFHAVGLEEDPVTMQTALYCNGPKHKDSYWQKRRNTLTYALQLRLFCANIFISPSYIKATEVII